MAENAWLSVNQKNIEKIINFCIRESYKGNPGEAPLNAIISMFNGATAEIQRLQNNIQFLEEKNKNQMSEFIGKVLKNYKGEEFVFVGKLPKESFETTDETVLLMNKDGEILLRNKDDIFGRLEVDGELIDGYEFVEE
jgi:hypothetical protein